MEKSFEVTSHSDEEWGHNITFDTINVVIDDDIVKAAQDLLNSSDKVSTIAVNVDSFSFWLCNEKIDNNIIPTVSCQVIIEQFSMYCLTILDDNIEIYVEGHEI